MIGIKRIYDPVNEYNGYRILVDRIWPRGVSKDIAKLDLWMKEIAPSDALRKWFQHDPAKWDEFKIRYHDELLEKKDLIAELKRIERENKNVTLLYSAKDKEHNQAVALLEILEEY
ncbi:MAG: DUF488 domain-containing protein [Fermentimonas sp.]|nr:DUF488 domain-containing protein [Fermentimonas sp.]